MYTIYCTRTYSKKYIQASSLFSSDGNRNVSLMVGNEIKHQTVDMPHILRGVFDGLDFKVTRSFISCKNTSHMAGVGRGGWDPTSYYTICKNYSHRNIKIFVIIERT